MRSRYSAYALGLIDYLLATWHPSTAPGEMELPPVKWIDLEVRHTESSADAVMIGRGVYGRPWIAGAIARALDGSAMAEPDLAQRLAIVLDHFRETLRFYGDALGLKNFKKHLGWYIEAAPSPHSPEERRRAKACLCQIDEPQAVERALTELWLPALRVAA